MKPSAVGRLAIQEMRSSTFADGTQKWVFLIANTTQASPINQRSHAAGAAAPRPGNTQGSGTLKLGRLIPYLTRLEALTANLETARPHPLPSMDTQFS